VKHRLKWAAGAAAIVVCSAVAVAQSKAIPADLLALDRQRCMKDCEPGFGAETCKPLCDCTVEEFQKRLDFSKYLDLSAQLARGELSADNRTLLDGIANYCASQLGDAGVAVGSGDAKGTEN
jgi:hypothetical protein